MEQELVLKFQELEERLAKIEPKTEPEKPKQEFAEPDFFRDLMPTKADVPIVVAGVGAGSAEAVSGFLQSKVSQLATYKPEYIQALAGWGLYKYFQRKGGNLQYLSAFGGGIVIGAIGSLAKEGGYTLGRIGIHGSAGEYIPKGGEQAGTPAKPNLNIALFTPYSRVAL